MKKKCFLYFMLIILGASSCERNNSMLQKYPKFHLKSIAFQDGAFIPVKYTADGLNVSPELEWTNPPSETQSLALICSDPDAPGGTWVHWVIYNIPPDVHKLPEAFPKKLETEKKIRQGKNDFGKVGYGGPAPPPDKKHHYQFVLYALDTPLDLAPGVRCFDLKHEMKGHILAKTMLTGIYRR